MTTRIRLLIALSLIMAVLCSAPLFSREIKLVTRPMTEQEFIKFKALVGVYQEGKNYNEKYNGFGTGLRPPTEEEWQQIRTMPVLIDHVESLTAVAPPSHDNSKTKWFPPIGNQDGEGSCVCWACGYYTKTFQEAYEHNWDLSACKWEGGYSGHPSVAYQDQIFSPDFIYHQVNNGGDNGSYYSDNINLLERIGCATWAKMPYDPVDTTTWPSEQAYRQAPWYRSKTGYAYMYVETDAALNELKQMLANYNLAIISIYAGAYNQLTSNDLWTLDNYNPSSTNHANTIVGYDDNYGPYTEAGRSNCYGAFKVANSWGVGSWEKVADGFYYISYNVMKQRIRYFYYYENKVNYQPQTIAVFKISHPYRGECETTLGIGTTSSPYATKRFDDFKFKGGNWPFPANNMVLDITEFSPYMVGSGDRFFLKVYDGGSSTTGSIQSFGIEIYDNYASGRPSESYRSTDPPVNTRQSNYVYAQLVRSGTPGPWITVTSPNGGEVWDERSTQEITWTSYNISGKVNILMTSDGGNTWSYIFRGTDDDGSFWWTIGYVDEDQTKCRVKVEDANNPSIWDWSDNYFTIRNTAATVFTIDQPNGGEIWNENTTYNIQWRSQNSSGYVKLFYSFDEGASWTLISSSTPDDGIEAWTTPSVTSDQTRCRVKVEDKNNAAYWDMSNGNFTIRNITGPALGQYTAYKIPAGVNLPTIDGQLNESFWNSVAAESLLFGGVPEVWGVPWTNWSDNLVSWKAVWSDVSNELYVAVVVKDNTRGLFDHNIPGTLFQPWEDECLEFFTDGDNSGGSYDNSYTSAQQWMVTGENKRALVNYPNASQIYLYTGDDFKTAVSWGSKGDWICEAEFKIYNSLPSNRKILTMGDIIGWNIWYDDSDNLTYSNGRYLRDHQVGWVYNGVAYKNADYFGDIFLGGELPTLAVTAPNGGEHWFTGTQQTIAWTSSGTSGNVKIELTRNGGASWEMLFASTPDDHSQLWLVTGPASNNCWLKISDIDGYPTDLSNNAFYIEQQQQWITVQQPNGGEIWNENTSYELKWSSLNTSGNVSISYSIDSGSSWRTIYASTPDDGSASWITPTVSADVTTCRIKVQDAINAAVWDMSDNDFTIKNFVPSEMITVIQPNGGEIWTIGSNQEIKWTSQHTSGSVKIELTRNGGLTWELLYASTPDDHSQFWTVVSPASNNCQIRISDTDGNPSDISDATFTITSAPQWIMPITISGGGTSFTRTIGGEANATDGFDAGLDEIAAPPGMTYYAYFEIVGFPNYLATDIRRWVTPFNTDIVWKLKIVNATGIVSNLTWNPGSLPTSGNFRLTGNGLSIDMRSQSSASVNGIAELEIRYGTIASVLYSFPQQGWYLISLPLTPSNNSLSSLFPTAIAAFGYNSASGTYYPATALEPRKGYWLLIPAPTTATISGIGMSSYVEHYSAGWHLIGSVIGTTNFTDPNDYPHGSVFAAYGYDPMTGKYFTVYPPGTGNLSEKQGYWLAVSQACDLTIGSGAMAAPEPAVAAESQVAEFVQQFGSQPPAPPFLAAASTAAVVPQTDRIVARNYPNPFNPETMIEYSLPQSGRTQVHIYNAMGQRIRTLFAGEQSAGVHQLRWDGRNEQQESVADGIYFYLIITPNFRLTQKMVLLR